jgi:hypothetical protein
MTRDDLIRMARESNLMSVKFSTALEEMWVCQLERFANLVAAEEREACAVIAFNAKTYIEAANAIRARKQHD